MGSRSTSFPSEQANRLNRSAKPRESATQASLRVRVGERPFYEVVATLGAQLADLPTASAGQGVDEAIRLIGESLPAERVALYLRSADATSFVEIARFSRAADGCLCAGDPDALLASAEGLEGFCLADYPWLAGQLAKSESVYWYSARDLPEIASAERSLFREKSLASLLFVPMLAHGVLLGFLKIDAVGTPRRWAAESRALTRVTLGMVTSLLERKRNEETVARAEARLQTPQRLEIIGRLASGIAHDFNNYLTAILGYGELLSVELEEDHRGQDDIHEIRRAADRASVLVEQILGFSRAKSNDPKIIDLNSVVAVLAKIIDRVAGEGVEVVYHLGADIGAVRVDPIRFDQVILNLVANARDAMAARGGSLTIATNAARVCGAEVVEFDVGRPGEKLEVSSPAGLASGAYVVMSVLDTGCGMSEATRARLFEPFYTTKRGGRGTGIGLSTVAGIVDDCGGAIVVDSEVGKGSAFHLFLPTAEERASSRGREARPHPIPPGQGETLLLVEPESLVRGLLERVLTRCGYEVLAAEDEPSALRVCDTHNGPIHLLMTDLAMPRLCGREIAERVSRVRPSIRVLFTSGYSEQVLRDEGVWDASAPVVEKPFALHTLAEKVREALDLAARSSV